MNFNLIFKKVNISKKILIVLGSIFVAIFVIAFYFLMVKAPQNFPSNYLARIKQGESLKQISFELEKEGLISSQFVFSLSVRLLAGSEGAKAGDYFFDKSENIFSVAKRISAANFGLAPVKITIPEGATINEISYILDKKLDSFDMEKFLQISGGLEGFLFPDTYLFLPNVTEESVLQTMRDNFDTKVLSVVSDKLKDIEKNLSDIIIMASLLEEEARTTKTRKMISGILWQRLKIGMPLQVDAVFPYIIGKNTFQLTREDLKVDSPYNTYRYKGLPQGPITNPGLDSIFAAIYPEESDFLFYLSDSEGNMYYAQTFAEHKINKSKYVN